MGRRLFVFLVVLFCALGVLLLLSALLETPAAEDEPAPVPVANAMTSFISMPPTPESASALSVSAWLRIAALFAVALVLVPCAVCVCDANGRVLRHRRYARSFHPVFKQEFACG